MNTYPQHSRSFLFLVALFLVSIVGCRGDWKNSTPTEWDPIEQLPFPTHPFGDQGTGGGSNDNENPHTFVSGLQIETCGWTPPQIETPRITANIGCRATMHVTPYWEDGDGNMEEIDAQISWFSDDSDWATINTPDWINDHDVAWGLSSGDLFDGDGVHEPTTFFHACTMNSCLPNDVGCQVVVCAEPITVFGVANLEGMWWFRTDEGAEPTTITIFQDGRMLTVAPWQKQGSVQGANVSWSADGQIFQGVLSDRNSVSGLRWDEMGLNVVGTWKAWR
ncbi:hypothetical protein KBD18_00225 [Patescibacteria group bacterium]|nr:hypothetical protein [Patescibacteria group bacterium]